MDAINNMEFDYVASGHYAHVIHPVLDQIDKPSVLELSKDMVSEWEHIYWSFAFFVSFALQSVFVNCLKTVIG